MLLPCRNCNQKTETIGSHAKVIRLKWKEGEYRISILLSSCYLLIPSSLSEIDTCGKYVLCLWLTECPAISRTCWETRKPVGGTAALPFTLLLTQVVVPVWSSMLHSLATLWDCSTCVRARLVLGSHTVATTAQHLLASLHDKSTVQSCTKVGSFYWKRSHNYLGWALMTLFITFVDNWSERTYCASFGLQQNVVLSVLCNSVGFRKVGYGCVGVCVYVSNLILSVHATQSTTLSPFECRLGWMPG